MNTLNVMTLTEIKSKLEGSWEEFENSDYNDPSPFIGTEAQIEEYITDKLGEGSVDNVNTIERGKTYPYNRDNPYSHDVYSVKLSNGMGFQIQRQYGVPLWSGKVLYIQRLTVR